MHKYGKAYLPCQKRGDTMHTENRFVTAEGRTGRVILAKLQIGSDLVGGLVELCRQLRIPCAAVGLCFGSLSRCTLNIPGKPQPGTKGAPHGEDTVVDGPVSLIAGQGHVSLTDPQQPVVHFHAVISDTDGRVYGGHINPGGSPVASTVELVITELLGAHMARETDPELGRALCFPRQGA